MSVAKVLGIETEYGLTCTFRGQRQLSPDEVARYLFRGVVSWGRSSNVFLRNGGTEIEAIAFDTKLREAIKVFLG